ncbi:MAG TPA: biotin carboxylase N-terminal domain-containing protein, partial [Burkholderiaceae bacterium]|nr:biotin carboxylase N-terminal domain-containing protein [Burkholderiaceae bacterium]
MFSSLLIANRGEIACRILRTARRLGMRTIAVYSTADEGALHVRMADAAVCIGPANARESYLHVDRIIAAARANAAEAIHPGYGFLSESAHLAQACEQAGICFVGPPAQAIRAMGSKSAAKGLLQSAGVPLTPGYHGTNQDASFLATEAGRIGFPVLIKASAGGGGKGMRRVDHAQDFGAALAACQREALAAFGSAHVLIEKFIEQPRHIEIQIFADRHDNVVHLFERDCSVQRRHQKVLEEAPAPGLAPGRRAQMGRAAIQVARAVGYVGAGTVEFIVPRAAHAHDVGETFYFMEMNTRLQVEHPVT